MSLRIKPKAEEPSLVKTSFKLKEPTLMQLQAYLKAYEQTYGKPIDEDYLVNEILEDFFSSDKKFQAYLKDNPVSGALPAKGRRSRKKDAEPGGEQ